MNGFKILLLLIWLVIASVGSGNTLLETALKSWTYQLPEPPETFAADSFAWSRRKLDHYVWKSLQENELQPSKDADAVTLLRRLCFDLIGLPPTMEQVKAFSERWKQDPEMALEELVNHLLHSPAFGERWGKHWLDVARYAESNGREANLIFPHAWRYRDYVIEAFNQDLPFKQFIIEQLAGDLLQSKNPKERSRHLVATGFLAMGAKGLGEFDKDLFVADLADEQVDTVFRAFLGSSLACARCHHHFTEPYTMEDYYGVVGIFKNTKTYFGNWIDSENNNNGDVLRLPEFEGQRVTNFPIPKKRLKQLRDELNRMDEEEKEDSEFAERAEKEGRDLRGDFNRLLERAIGRHWRRGQIGGELRTVDVTGKPFPLAMGVMDGEIKPSTLFERGELSKPGKETPRSIPQIFRSTSKEIEFSKNQSGRLELAQWLASQRNPLTARVLVNRVWRHLFGSGLLRTVDQFGISAEEPSHPEIIDLLALHFMDSNWSIKSLIKEIVLSRTYRQASDYREEAFQVDPDNKWIWRVSKKRMDAEVIRDSMLSIARKLNTSPRVGSLVHEISGQSASIIGFSQKIPQDLDGSYHRSVYLPIIRDMLPDVLEHFDAANASLVTGDRSTTHSPLQSLYLLNGSFTKEMSQGFAKYLLQHSSTKEELVVMAFMECFSREPSMKEKVQSIGFMDSLPPDLSELDRCRLFTQALFSSAEFRMVD